MRDKNNSLPELPKGWVWTRLGEIARIRNGFAFKSRNYQDEGILLIRQSNLEKRRVNVEKAVHLPNQFLNKYSEFIIRKGDILVGMSGSIGKSCIYDLETPALQNQRTGLIHFLEPRMKQLIRYYLDTLEGQLLFLAKGVGVQNVSAREIESCPIPIPPLPEQRRIVTKIEELFTKLDAGVEALKTAKRQLKRFRQATLKAAIEGRLTAEWREQHKDELEPADKLLEHIQDERKAKLGTRYKEVVPVDTTGLPELPERWSVSTVGSLYYIIGGGTPSTRVLEYWNGKIPWITSADISDQGKICPRRSVTQGGIDNSATNLVPQDSLIVVTRVGLGKVALTDFPLCFSQDSQALIGAENYIYPKFAFYHLLSAVQVFKYRSRGTTISGVTKRQLFDLPFFIPPHREQNEIVKRLESLYSAIDTGQFVVKSELKRAQSLRQAILKRAFEGKLVGQDPSDAPVEELLERIKTDRAKRETEDGSKKKRKGKIKPRQGRLI